MEIVLLTREDCAFCHDAEAILGRLSTEFAITVTTVDLDTPEGRELAEQGGVMFPPGIVIDGRPFSYGRASERKLRRHLEKLLGPVARA